MENPKIRLERFRNGVDALSSQIPETIKSLFGFIETAQKDRALTAREKELIAIGISIYHRCEDCIVVHVEKALEAGCTRQEILEAAGIGIVFGGGPSLASSATLLLDALDEFEKGEKNERRLHKNVEATGT
jgi:AhpD family alkylhydroperoxidase